MSDDEIIVLVASLFVGLLSWGTWTHSALAPGAMYGRRSERWAMTATPLACAPLLLAVLLTLAASDVRDSVTYTFFYMVFGAAWIGASAKIVPALAGLSPRDDVVQRRNKAASYATVGALVGLTLAFAGGNIGDGPGWWCVLFAAALATGSLLAFWLALEAMTHITEATTIDRDAASGMRLGALLAAAGLMFGRGVAGDWVSVAATVTDFVELSWPVAMLLAMESIVTVMGRPTAAHPERPVALFGAIPAIVYLAMAAVYVVSLGSWA